MNTSADESPVEKPALPWKNILAPTDFSEPSRQSVKTAAALAAQCGAKVILLHVVHLPVSGAIEAALDMDEIVNSSRQSLEEISREIPVALIQEKLVRLGPQGAVQGIVELAREISVDLIVIATHSHGRLERALLGSTAEKVVRHAPCPVLVVRAKDAFSQPSQPRRD